jgi:hypothetical protein
MKKNETQKLNEETASNNNDLSNKPYKFQTYHQVKREASHR